jgi:hypothetical protein
MARRRPAFDALVAVDSPGAIVVSDPVAPFLARASRSSACGTATVRPGGSSAWKRRPAAGPRRVSWQGRRLALRGGPLAAQGTQVVGIVGEAGVGKSRLVREATRGLPGWRLLSAGGAPYTQETPCAPLIELLRGLCHVLPADDAAEVKERVTRALPADAEPRLVLPPVLDLFSAPCRRTISSATRIRRSAASGRAMPSS